MEFEEHAVMPLAGGMVGHGYQCGMIWGATLAAGAQAYRLLGAGPEAEAGAIIAAQRLVESFRGLKNTIDCFDITGLNKSSSTMQMIGNALLKGGMVGCLSLSARYAHAALSETKTALSERHFEAPPPPVSCAALLAQKMGVSDMHTVMAAGLAGGIGLSGGACGALGAAIWMIGTNILKSGGKIRYNAPSARAAIDLFTKCTNNELECAKIVGRNFRDIGDHAMYLGDGGCSEIIEVLAATSARSPASK